jgi:hypothetical protein
MRPYYNYRIIFILFGLFFCCVFGLPSLWKGQLTEASEDMRESNEVVLIIAGEEERYLPSPELGYVVRLQDDNQIGPLSSGSIGLLKNVKARPIGGRARSGLWIVEGGLPFNDYASGIGTLSSQGQLQYIAPLFISYGEKVAIIPEIVVKLKENVAIEQLMQVCDLIGCAINKPMEFTTQEYLLDVLGADADAVFFAVEEFNKIDCVEWVAPNVACQGRPAGEATGQGYPSNAPQISDIAGFIPNDEYMPMQWHLHNTGQFGYTPDADINAVEAWEITAGDPNIVIAILDDGVDMNHPDLVDNLVPGYDFQDDDDLPNPEENNFGTINNHGTMCAGLAAAKGNNYIGVIGVAWNCKIMPIRISYKPSPDSTNNFITNADKATAFRWAANHGADILSNSWTGANQVVRSAIIDITMPGGMGRDGKGCVVFAASGNEDGASVGQPARFPEVVAVGATGEDGQRWDYSNYGPELDVMAPSGEFNWGSQGIMSTKISRSEGETTSTYMSGCTGTSTATPIAAGVGALILSLEPGLTSDEVRHILLHSAKDLGEPGEDDFYGWGRLDARAALEMVLAMRCDLNGDWRVDEQDMVLLNEYIANNDMLGDIAPAAKRDSFPDDKDIELMIQYMGTEIPEMPTNEANLIAHWKFDEIEGTIAYGIYDIYGERTPAGQVHGNALWLSDGGISGGAIQLDGINDYISTSVTLEPIEGDFSVFAWIKGGTAGEVIISQEGGANWLMADEVDGGLRTDLKAPAVTGRAAKPAGPPLIASASIIDGDWHQAGFVRDGGERIIYVDDIEVARDTAEHLEPSSGVLNIGTGTNMEAGTFWSGLIDDVRIYNRVVVP